MKRRAVWLLLCALPLLMAMQCDEDQTLFANNIKIRITPENTLKVGDTLWVKGMMSSKGYDSKLRDSVRILERYTDLGIFKLIKPLDMRAFNARDAFDSFEFVDEFGRNGIYRPCNTTQISLYGKEVPERTLYIYRVGFVAKEQGDFFIEAGIPSEILNEDYHSELMEEYAFPVKSNRLLYDDCGNRTTILAEGDEYSTVYFFKVE